ncbi:hypothetical protein EYW49_22745 [Siculibacillus lacustris]|uniref:Uncharacterized protein n=1 Tax=Siculibacillus lacustris TaxID=1549641 RepID=A0A4Q9VDV8_9HYPH|nr:hypothetical protein [Siculibacillus lacustris]TBW31869.1 hypothetical protein EYW49_22745 [Siculibacillus lacustris]
MTTVLVSYTTSWDTTRSVRSVDVKAIFDIGLCGGVMRADLDSDIARWADLIGDFKAFVAEKRRPDRADPPPFRRPLDGRWRIARARTQHLRGSLLASACRRTERNVLFARAAPGLDAHRPAHRFATTVAMSSPSPFSHRGPHPE